MNDQVRPRDFDKRLCREREDDVTEAEGEDALEISCRDILCRHEQEPCRDAAEDVRVDEVRVLRDKYASIAIYDRRDEVARRPIPGIEVKGVESVVALGGGRPAGAATVRRPGISCRVGLDPFDLRHARRELKGSEHIVALEILVVAEDLLSRHSGTEQLEE